MDGWVDVHMPNGERFSRGDLQLKFTWLTPFLPAVLHVHTSPSTAFDLLSTRSGSPSSLATIILYCSSISSFDGKVRARVLLTFSTRIVHGSQDWKFKLVPARSDNFNSDRPWSGSRRIIMMNGLSPWTSQRFRHTAPSDSVPFNFRTILSKRSTSGWILVTAYHSQSQTSPCLIIISSGPHLAVPACLVELVARYLSTLSRLVSELCIFTFSRYEITISVFLTCSDTDEEETCGSQLSVAINKDHAEVRLQIASPQGQALNSRRSGTGCVR